jgi:prepilin-type N-terminal cleavage/methylation domain-containing protein
LRCSAFTLIELLVVVAIIAILAAIAAPNFLEAQTRAKVGRVKSDMRSIAVALESYTVDWNRYPESLDPVSGQPTGTYNYIQFTPALSTPVAYLSSTSLSDPFNRVPTLTAGILPAGVEWMSTYHYVQYKGVWGEPILVDAGFRPNGWVMTSYGPDLTQVLTILVGHGPVEGGLGWYPYIWIVNQRPDIVTSAIYDPTNGSISSGDMARLGGEFGGVPVILGE